MRKYLHPALVIVLACILLSCASGPRSGPFFVRQRIPVEIARGKAITFDVNSLSGNGPNDVGIRCSPEIWNVLTNGTIATSVQLKSSNKSGVQIYGVDAAGTPAGFLYRIPDVHYLFEIVGPRRAKASIEITFPNAPAQPTRAEIIVCKTPADTAL
jgi:hypothetical protein